MGKRFNQFKRVFLLLVLSISSLFMLTSANVFATEGGGGAYPNGAEDFMSGAIPPPGTYFINYLWYYHADDFNNKHGDNVDEDFDVDVIANIFRFIYITKHKILGANWGVHMFVPIVYQDVTPPFTGRSDTQVGLGDIIVDPLILSWHFSKNFHLAAGIDIYIPTGRYDAGRDSDEYDLANTSRNYWTFEPIVAFTYMSDFGLEVSSKFMYDINTNNPDTDYRSGQEFHFDYAVGYKVSDWTLGVAGFYYKQFTNDKINGEKVTFPDSLGFEDGFKGQAIAVGPAVKYGYKNMSFTLKYLWETEVEHKSEGQNLWFKFVYAF